MLLSTNHITVSDLDTPRKELLVWLVAPPKYGFIENTKPGESRLLDLLPFVFMSRGAGLIMWWPQTEQLHGCCTSVNASETDRSLST